VAWQYAFNTDLLKRNGVDIDTEMNFVIEGEEPAWDETAKDTLRIAVEIEYPWKWRADALLARRVPLSRKKLEQLFREGGLKLTPPVKDLRSILREPFLVEISLSTLQSLRLGEKGREGALKDSDNSGGE
jgi:hypothetical protein